MAKRALCNLSTGDIIIEKGKIYRDEDVANIDPTNFEDTEAEVDTEPRTGVVGEETATAKPDLDTEEVKEDTESVVTEGNVDETEKKSEETGSEDTSDNEDLDEDTEAEVEE